MTINADRNAKKTVYVADCRIAMRSLIDYCKETGELDKYWNNIQSQNDKQKRAAYRVKQELQRLAVGDEYESTGDGIPDSEDESSDWSE